LNAVKPTEDDCHEKVFVVCLADAVVKDFTMMIKVVHASIAFVTVYCAFKSVQITI
jgi:hypothetical protein